MPHIFIKIPQGAFPAEHRSILVRKLNDAAASAEQIPDQPRQRFLAWVMIDEVSTGSWTCGGLDMTAQILPCIAEVHVPAGVLDAASQARYVQLIDAAFKQALPASEKRHLHASIVLHEVADGHWGINGEIWRLPDFALAAGFRHLQSLDAA